MMLKKISSLLTTFCVFMLAFSSSAFANHYIWLIDDSSKQLSSFTGTESRISWWVLNGTVTTRTAPTSMQTDVNTAVNNWNNSIPIVRISGSGSDLQFSESTTFCSAGAAGCHAINSTYNDTTRGANFTLSSKIVLNSSTNRVNVLAHEIGHYLGFHEQYYDDGTSGVCNPNSTSIMDGSNCDNLFGPSATDISRFNGTLGGGWATATNLNVLQNGSNFLVRWNDQSLGELHYIVDYYRVTSSGLSYLYTVNVTANTGLRQGLSWTSNRTISDTFSSSGRPSGTYRAVVTPYYKSSDSIGNQVYTNFSF